MCSAPPNGFRDTQHPTWRFKHKKAFQWGGRSLHTTRSITQIFVGVVYHVLSHLYDFCCGSDCIYQDRHQWYSNPSFPAMKFSYLHIVINSRSAPRDNCEHVRLACARALSLFSKLAGVGEKKSSMLQVLSKNVRCYKYFPVLLSTLIRSWFQIKSATLLIPFSFSVWSTSFTVHSTKVAPFP